MLMKISRFESSLSAAHGDSELPYRDGSGSVPHVFAATPRVPRMANALPQLCQSRLGDVSNRINVECRVWVVKNDIALG